MRQLGFSVMVGVAPALLLGAALLALRLAVLITLFLVRRFRAAVNRSMQAAAAGAPDHLENQQTVLCGASGKLKFARYDVGRTEANSVPGANSWAVG